MGITRRHMPLPASAVWEVLADGYTYGHWVVGTRMIREVDAAWPAKGSELQYTVGYGPLRKDDRNEVMSVTTGTCLEMRAHAWPAGSARIAITVAPAEAGCTVEIDEHVLDGPAKKLQNPLTDLGIHLRNKETLRRLQEVAVRRAATS